MKKIMVTGASGFVGQALCKALQERGIDFVPVVRRQGAFPNAFVVDDIGPSTNWQAGLRGVEVVVHLAARVHVLNDTSSDPMREYRRANVDATLRLARECAAAGVRRFIFISSIKVNGEETTIRPFSSHDTPGPTDPYGISKYEAEQALKAYAAASGLEVVIIRPPLVYGPLVKANFLQLMRWIKRGVPFPLASADNRRDMVYVGNLVDLIICCASSAAAAGQTFLVSDGWGVSTAELIRAIGSAMNKKAILFPFPLSALVFFARVARKEAITKRLLGSLELDIRHTMETLGWAPPYSFEYGVEQTVRQFLAVEKSQLR